MRAALWRRMAFGLLSIPLIGMGAIAQLPPTETLPRPGALPPFGGTSADKKLKTELAAMAGDRKAVADDSLGAERQKLRSDLLGLIRRIESMPPPGATTPKLPAPSHTTKPKTEPIDGTKPVDTLRRAMNLFRDNDFDAAYSVFGQLLQDLPQLPREDRVFVRYMAASCLRRLNKIAEAQAMYREAAEMTEQDEFFAECATSQLALIRSNQDLEAQLAQLRAKPKGK